MNYYQIIIFFLQGTLVSFLILLLFHLRKKLGIGILFACLGLFQFMQVFLSSTVYVEIAKNFMVSPGSVVLFTATLFAVLIIYIKEDASETKKIIYALLITNIVMAFLIQSFGWNFREPSIYNPFNVSKHLFDNNAWVLFIGTVALFLDSLLIIVTYEFVSRTISGLFLRICFTMLVVIGFDTCFFSILAFWNYENLSTILTSGLISKGLFAIFYSIIFYIYLQYIDKKGSSSDELKVIDVFRPLTYRQKFEIARLDAIKTSEDALLSEIKYKTLTDISPVGIFHTRVDGFTTFVNPKWCEISGLSMEEAIGDGWMKAVHSDDIVQIKKEWESTTHQKRISETQYRFILKDGSIRWVLGRAVPELDSHDHIIGYIGTITDITKLIQFQQEQMLLKEKAEESDRLKSAFLANMSHEIRTPMNGIIGFANLLKEPDLSSEMQQKYIQIIKKSGDRMLNIINDIVSISKIESGINDIHLTLTNIKNQLQFVFDTLKMNAENRNLCLSYTCTLSDDEGMITTDSEKFNSILSNLVKNAIKYTDKGSVHFGCIKKRDTIEFYVRDTGIGIPEEKREAIFERFIQADITDKMARQGAGLGLAISRAYVEMLGGRIWVESEEGKGSAFYFTLPCQFASEIDTSTKACSEKLEQPVIPNGPLLKVLIAEDDEDSEMLISMTIQALCKEIITVDTGIDAVDTCRRNPDIDLVLMDIQMPEMNGYQATREIRKFNQKVIIIAQTAFAITGDKEKALEAGCNNYISKPTDKVALLAMISSYFKMIYN